MLKSQNVANNVLNNAREAAEEMEKVENGGKQIVSSIYEVARISKDIMGQIQTVNSAMQEQSLAMEEITNASQYVMTVGQDMQQGINYLRGNTDVA